MLIFVLCLGLGFFALAELRVLVILYYSLTQRRQKPDVPSPDSWPGGAVWPSVVVQLPVYREHQVLRRLLAAVVNMEYPSGRMAVQVLDDSEGDEARLAEEMVAPYRDGPVSVEYIHRSARAGYKSGALNFGHRQAAGDLVAIFDADFIPHPDFLKQTVPAFQHERVGAVHARWDFLNDSASPLTMLLQAGVLDSLFLLRSRIRCSRWGNRASYLGTNGVWRKSVVDVHLGGWREAPFTDDGIDLSARAQTAGWVVSFVDAALSSSELPDTYLAYKNQQRRWARAALRIFFDHWRQAFGRSSGIGSKFLELSLLHLELSMPCLLLVALATGLYVALGLPRSAVWFTVQIGLMAVPRAVSVPALEVVLLAKAPLSGLAAAGIVGACGLSLLAIGVSVSILAGFWDTIRRSNLEFVPTPRPGADAVIRSSRRRWLESSARIAALEILLGGARADRLDPRCGTALSGVMAPARLGLECVPDCRVDECARDRTEAQAAALTGRAARREPGHADARCIRKCPGCGAVGRGRHPR